MEATAKVTYVRIAPRKVQIVLDLIRNKPCDEAMANAENKDMDVSRLYVAACNVGPGPILKRIRPRAQGRAFRINKRTSHINIVLKEAE